MLILGFEDYEDQGRRLAQSMSLSFARVEVHRFPDGESKVTLPRDLPERLIVCRSLNLPNSKLIELLMTAETARQNGVREIILVAPYLCYMRQDIAFQPGEAVSQRIVGRFLAGLFDAVITVDAHLHRINSLSEALPHILAVNTSAGPLMSEFLQRRSGPSLLVGPDIESTQWVEAIARDAGYPCLVAQKRRFGDRHVEISLPPGNYRDQHIVLIDDVISTGHTLVTVTGLLFERGAAAVDVLVTHALYDESAANEMRQAGIGTVWSTDSVPHASNTLHLDRTLTDILLQHASPEPT
jgi:ribose-phosphate pyrophosphokinase